MADGHDYFKPPDISDDRWAKSCSGIGSGEEWNQRVQEALGISLAYLTEPQWKEIQQISRFSRSARFEINIALRRYWDERIKNLPNSASRRAVEETKSKLGESLRAVQELLLTKQGPLKKKAALFGGIAANQDQSALDDRLALEGAVLAIQRAVTMLSIAEERIDRPNKAGPLWDLIHHLDYILWKEHRFYVSRSEKRMFDNPSSGSAQEYIRAVVKVANPDIGATVDAELQSYITHRGDINRRAYQEQDEPPFCHLTGSEWQHIKHKTGFRESARFEMNLALMDFHSGCSVANNEKICDAAKEAVGKLERGIDGLIDILLNHNSIFDGQHAFHERPRVKEFADTAKSLPPMIGALSVLKYASEISLSDFCQFSYGAVYNLIQHLDFVLRKQHAIRLTASDEPILCVPDHDTAFGYVRTVFRVAGIEIAEAFLDNVIQHYVSDRDRHGRDLPGRAI